MGRFSCEYGVRHPWPSRVCEQVLIPEATADAHVPAFHAEVANARMFPRLA